VLIHILLFAVLFVFGDLTSSAIQRDNSSVLQHFKDNILATYGCSATISGQTYSIASLASTTQDFTSAVGGYTYYLNPCGIVNGANYGTCSSGEATFCQTGGVPRYVNLGTNSLAGAALPSWLLIANGVQVVYENGDLCTASTVTRIGKINFICVEGTGRGVVVGSVIESPVCTYTMTINTPAVCPQSSPGTCSISCLNGGSCVSSLCICPPYYSGSTCETYTPPSPSIPCSTLPCVNGGSCVPSGMTYSCTCPALYSGYRCEIKEDHYTAIITAVSVSLGVVIIGLSIAVFYLCYRLRKPATQTYQQMNV